MHWIYIIKSKRSGSLYIGSTPDLKKRLTEHNSGKSKTTAKYIPWVLVYTKGYSLKKDVITRERKLKAFGKVYSQLKRRISDSTYQCLKGAGLTHIYATL